MHRFVQKRPKEAQKGPRIALQGLKIEGDACEGELDESSTFPLEVEAVGL